MLCTGMYVCMYVRNVLRVDRVVIYYLPCTLETQQPCPHGDRIAVSALIQSLHLIRYLVGSVLSLTSPRLASPNIDYPVRRARIGGFQVCSPKNVDLA